MSTNTDTHADTTSSTPSQPGLRGPCQPESRTWVRDMIESIADKWTILVIEALAGGTLRFTAIQTEVSGISHRMLTRTLRSLERDGMITRTAYAEVPPRVDYSLTPLGRTLIEPVDAFIRWAENHRSIIDENRRAFDDQ